MAKVTSKMMASTTDVVKAAVDKGFALVGAGSTPSWREGCASGESYQHVVVWAGKKLMRPGYAQSVLKALDLLEKAGTMWDVGESRKSPTELAGQM